MNFFHVIAGPDLLCRLLIAAFDEFGSDFERGLGKARQACNTRRVAKFPGSSTSRCGKPLEP